jgi:predicted N-acetyltransferase YhbS
VDIRLQADADNQDVASLMTATFGAGRSNRAVWHLRRDEPVKSLSLVALRNSKICGSLRFWEVMVCGHHQLLLGPLAVQFELHGKGFGHALVVDGLRRAQQHSQWDFVLVSGDPEYYLKFGFTHTIDSQFILPGNFLPNVLQIRALHKDGLAHLPDGPMAVLPLAAGKVGL